ncbi:uncharacterized protein LOC127795031 [Diospyros lotus]|uniref:uncharacterized protein LOC127795031 n=1 Tax=Diospyros lotus TaxID=55363 RepID=UPI002255674C|nr:uncharacterized protein LOC127795031 [Diospyros lotus]XP_052182411.1 uncharacterized protein LOC127795031 [Diospyros lotus]
MDFQKCARFIDAPSLSMVPLKISSKWHAKAQFEEQEKVSDNAVIADVDIDLREVYFLILHFLSAGPCQRTLRQLGKELLEHDLLPRRYHAWYSRDGAVSGQENDDGISFPSSYDELIQRYPHVEMDHLVKLLKQLILSAAPSLDSMGGRSAPSAVDVPTLLGAGSFSLLGSDREEVNRQFKPLPRYLRWPHLQADQVRGLHLREIGGGFQKHHRSPSIHYACYTVAKPSTMVQKMQNIKKIRGHRSAVYCAIFDRSGRYVITGSDDRLVKIWSMETAFCLASCRGHEGDITDLAVSSNNALVASASNDYSIRVWRLPDGLPISVLRGHVGAVTAIAFSPRPSSVYQLLSSSDDGTCRIWDARYSQCSPRVYLPKPTDGKNSGSSSSNGVPCHQILCCTYNASGTVFVTGSSDTFARVWNACKSNTEGSEQPNHEIDVLAGHENDVNYVQFSGCAVAPRSSSPDFLPDDSKQKFKNSWFNHDNIVTCSRDGSAIIWVARSRKSHGKAVRWTRAYHLKVPPPPMPPQPPRGGPRQRFLPTPRGVNMIVWSLDNRFVLAAIMDCRICVWNASDGSLVHSLTGHTQSTYVLDVHPFNPRIAMSAGYDGKTIIWDIWEGMPIRVYEIGRFKLVDGKFSQDGTSIVLSDDAGQIYLLNTGQGESQKDAKYDQFFLGDYRPLIQDTHGNVIDQETQLVPYRRNIQDALCDSSMIPYPEPYQSRYQRRRLGALGIEWRPSSVKFAIGTDIGLGQEILPLADLDVVIDPLPEFIDAMYWEPENEVINDDTDSEYNVTEEYSSEAEEGSFDSISPSDPECSDEDNMVDKGHKDGLRRSKRRKPKSEVKLTTSSGRCIKRRNLDGHDNTPSRTKRVKKHRNSRATSKRKTIKAKSSRPQRVAARNALNLFYHIESSTNEEESVSGDDSSGTETALQDSDMQSNEPECNLQKDLKADQTSSHGLKDVIKHPEPRKLVVRFSLRDSKKSVTSGKTRLQNGSQVDLAASSSSPTLQTPKEDWVNLTSEDPGSSSANATNSEELSGYCNRTELSDRAPPKVENHLETSIGYKESKIRWGEVKVRTSKQMKPGDLVQPDASIGSSGNFVSHDGNRNEFANFLKFQNQYGFSFPSSQVQSYGRGKLLNGDCRDEERPETGVLENMDCSEITGLSTEDVNRSLSCDPIVPSDHHQASRNICHLGDRDLINECRGSSGADACRHHDLVGVTNHSDELKGNPPPKPTKIRIKSKIFKDPDSPSQLKLVHPVDKPTSAGGDLMSKRSQFTERNLISGVSKEDEGCDLPSSVLPYCSDSKGKLGDVGCRRAKSNLSRSISEAEACSIDLEENGHNFDTGVEFPEAATNATRRTRSMGLKATSREMDAVDHNCADKFSKKKFNQQPSEGWMTNSKLMTRSRSTRNKGGARYDNDECSSAGRKSHIHQKASNWLTLPQQEDGYRYIPQLADEVVYLRQGHQEYLESSPLSEVGPWESIKGRIRAVEFCSVESLDYAILPGSGDSCCKITLKFTDHSSSVLGEVFKFTLPELNDFPDFVVERTRYDAAIRRNWTCRDRCLVWWRDESELGGSWWGGRILSSKDKSNEFPGSPWERYAVLYKGDTTNIQQHSPWELHDPESPWEHPRIDNESRDKLLSSLDHLQRSARNQDPYGIRRLNQIALKPEFINRVPAPLSPGLIELRLKKKYYRSLKAVKHDLMVMMANAQDYLGADKRKRLSDWVSKRL